MGVTLEDRIVEMACPATYSTPSSPGYPLSSFEHIKEKAVHVSNNPFVVDGQNSFERVVEDVE